MMEHYEPIERGRTLVVGWLAFVSAEDFDGGEALNAVLAGELAVRICIEGAKLDDTLESRRGLGPFRSEVLAVTAPRSCYSRGV